MCVYIYMFLCVCVLFLGIIRKRISHQLAMAGDRRMMCVCIFVCVRERRGVVKEIHLLCLGSHSLFLATASHRHTHTHTHTHTHIASCLCCPLLFCALVESLYTCTTKRTNEGCGEEKEM